MPIEGLPQRMRELGRLRMGEKATSKGGKPYPVKRTTWRFTSQSPEMLAVIAELHGGEVESWPEAPGQGTYYQLRSEAGSIPVLIPVGHSLSQWMEFWTADGCTRRCTGKVNVIDETPCVCPADISERMEAASADDGFDENGKKKYKVPTACKPTTRLNVMLPDVPDLGFWRLEAHGYQAAIELPGALAQYVGLARMYAGVGADLDDLILRAELAIEERSVKKPGQPRAEFVVPVIRTPQVTPSMLMSGAAPGLAAVRELDAPAPPALAASSVVGDDEPPPHVDVATGEVDEERRPFDSTNEKIVDRETALAVKAEAAAAGITGAALASLVSDATGGRCNVITKVQRTDWPAVEEAVAAASERVAS